MATHPCPKPVLMHCHARPTQDKGHILRNRFHHECKIRSVVLHSIGGSSHRQLIKQVRGAVRLAVLQTLHSSDVPSSTTWLDERRPRDGQWLRENVTRTPNNLDA